MHKKKIEIEGISLAGVFGRQYRFYIHSSNSLKKLLTLVVRPNGIIVSIKEVPVGTVKSFTKSSTISRLGSKEIKLVDMNTISVEPDDAPGKTSYHPSGFIESNNSREQLSFRQGHKTLDITEMLEYNFYPHLSELIERPSAKKYGIIFNRNIPENTHLAIKLLISPPNNDIVEDFVSPDTIGFVKLTFSGDTIWHSEKSIIVYVILEQGIISTTNKSNLSLSIVEDERLIDPEIYNRFYKSYYLSTQYAEGRQKI